MSHTIDPEDCTISEVHGNPFRYCPECTWIEPEGVRDLACCQYCLARTTHTPLGPKDGPRCPVCGSAYSGERRDREYRALVESGVLRGE